MDTRAKIKTQEELRPLLSQGSWTIVAGELDPVTAEVADFLANARGPGRKLLVVLRSNEEELLSAETRAVLVAGLRSVDAVFIARDKGWRSLAAEGSVSLVENDGSHWRHDFEALVLTKLGISNLRRS